VTTTDDELAAAFASGAVWGEDAARLRSAFRERFASLDDGHASERVVRAVWSTEGERAQGRREVADEPKESVEA
jgi:CDP-glycerol glycerophosphotransferase